MVSLGYLKYEDRIVTHWPEFGKYGKHDLTVQDVMRHESGMARLHQQIPQECLTTAAIKQNHAGKYIEADFIEYLFGKRRRYHLVTRDIISNEIFRRVEPKGRTMGEYLREEIAGSMVPGLDIHIGVQDKDLAKCQNCWWNPVTDYLNHFLSQADGRVSNQSFW